MKESDAKRLSHKAKELADITKKQLESSKSDKSKTDIISKQLERLDKDVEDTIGKIDSDQSDEGSSVIKLEFDKLNKRLDVIEAKEFVGRIYTLEVSSSEMKSVIGSTESDKNSNSDDSLIGQIKNLFGLDGKFSLDDLATLFVGKEMASSAINSLKSIGKFLTNPYLAIPLAAVAIGLGAYELIDKVHADTVKQINNIDTNISGTTKAAVEDYFKDFSGGQTVNNYITNMSQPGLSDEDREKIIAELKDVLGQVRGAVATDIGENTTDKSTIPTTGADLAVDAKSAGDNIRFNEKTILTTWDYIKELMFGEDKEKLYSESLSTIDMSALGSIKSSWNEKGESVNALDSAIYISSDYKSLSNLDYKSYKNDITDYNFMNQPVFNKFDYSNPIESIRKLAIDMTKLTCDYNKSSNPEEVFNDRYNLLFDNFTKGIGRQDGFFSNNRTLSDSSNLRTNWNGIKNSIKTSLRGESSHKASYRTKVYEAFPSYDDLISAYFKIEYSESKDNSDTASLMTIAKQYELLGASLDPHSKLNEVKDKFYFLPIKVNVPGDVYLDESIRVTLNQVGIIKAYRIYSGNYDQLTDDLSIVTDNIEAQNTRLAYGDSALNIDINSMINNLGKYTNDTTVMGIIGEYSGITDSDKQQEFANLLQSYSYEELENASNSKEGEVYESLLSYIPGNKKSSLNTVLNNITRYQTKWSSHDDDIIEYYNTVKSKDVPELTKESFDKIIEKIGKSKSIRDLYMKARNTKKGSQEYFELYKNLAKIFELDEDLCTIDTSIIDRIFNYYRTNLLRDEGDNDLDAYIHSIMGVSGYSLEDLSSTVDLFGEGTADEIKERYGFSDKELIDFLELAKSNQKLDSGLVADENGNLEQVYYTNKYNSMTPEVKDAIEEALDKSVIHQQLNDMCETFSEMVPVIKLMADSQQVLLMNIPYKSDNTNAQAASNTESDVNH